MSTMLTNLFIYDNNYRIKNITFKKLEFVLNEKCLKKNRWEVARPKGG